MKKIFFLCCILFSVLIAAAQGKYIQSKINQIPERDYIKHKIFKVKGESNEPFSIDRYVSNYTLATVSSCNLRHFVDRNYYTIEMDIPYQGGFLSLQLMRSQVISQNTKFTQEDQSGQSAFDYQPGVYYYGIVKGVKDSWAAISFFNNDIMGTIALPEGNIVIGKSNPSNFGSEEYIIYNDKDLKVRDNFTCGMKESLHTPIPVYTPEKATRAITLNCVKLYIECDYKVYQDFGNNVGNATNFATGLLNMVATLYLNDSVSTGVSQINVWTVTDPYISAANTSDALSLFANEMSGGFNGDLAHLLSRRSLGGGIAYLDVLCASNQYRTGVSASLSTTLTPLPTYSWNTMVVTHELGHNMGSKHTHACAWNGNNTRIDNCAGNYNVAYQEGNCNNFPPDPVGGGTIMSYCHLSNVGINLNLGFGPQPGTRIRAEVNGGACLTICENCNSNIVITGAYSDSLTESTTWIQSSGQTTIVSSAQVKLDPDPYDGYVLMMPGSNADFFLSEPGNINSYFVAQAYDGCEGFSPMKPTENETAEEDKDLIEANEYSLYPNPTDEWIHVSNRALSDVLLAFEIVSIEGKKIMDQSEFRFDKSFTVNVRHLPPGIYFIKIINKSDTHIIKFQKL